MKKHLALATASTIAAYGLVLTGCSPAGESDSQAPTQQSSSKPTAHNPSTESSAEAHSGYEHMNHSPDGGPVPAGMTPAQNPTYPVGTEVKLTADHMHGMKGATATIVGAYQTNTYAVNYTPTTGEPEVRDHRWVVQEELETTSKDRLADGTPVTLRADHMEGMNGAKATIAHSTTETVYVVDYEANGTTMTNHKWVVDSEMTPAR